MKRLLLIFILSFYSHVTYADTCVKYSDDKFPKCIQTIYGQTEEKLKRFVEHAKKDIKKSAVDMPDKKEWGKKYLIAFNESQEQWEKYRNSHCEILMKYISWGATGSGISANFDGCKMQLAKQRIEILKSEFGSPE